MVVPPTQNWFSPEEYYAVEHASEWKNEYLGGRIISMEQPSTQHARISTDLAGEVALQLKGTRFFPIGGTLRLKVDATGLRAYPDLSVFSGPFEYAAGEEREHTVTNPVVVFEILSEDTELFDRGLKSEHYRKIPSLLAYLLVAQDRAHVELYERLPDNVWRLTEVDGMDAVLPLHSLPVSLQLRNIYARAEFERPARLMRDHYEKLAQSTHEASP